MDEVVTRPRDLRDLEESAARLEPTAISAAWRYRWLVLFVVLVFAAAGLLVGLSRPPEYRASASLVVADPRASASPEDGTTGPDPERYVANQVAIITSTAVAQRAEEMAGQALASANLSTRDFLRRAEVVGGRESDLIEISFVAGDPLVAQVGANTLAAAYQEVRRDQARQNAQDALQLVDASLQQAGEDLSALASEIETVRGVSGARTQLDEQFQLALQSLADLQARRDQLSGTGSEELERIRAELADLEDQFRTLEILTGLEAQQNPELRALLAQQDSIIQRQAELEALQDQITVEAELVGGGVVLFSPAQLPGAGRGEVYRTLAVAIVFGLLAGSALAYYLAIRRRVFADRLEPELVLGAPILAEVPSFKEEGIKSPLPVRVSPTSASAEAFRFAAASLDIRMHRAGAKSIVLVSGIRGGGKSTVVANTGMASAREGNRVLLIDADFGNQALTELLLGNVMPELGLTEVVDSKLPLERALRVVPVSEGAGLSLLSRGRRPIVAPEFFRSEGARRFLRSVRDHFDLVLIDAPPLLQVAYASTLVGYADAAGVVIEHRSFVSQLEEVANRLSFIGTPVAGYVYNRAPLRARMTSTEGSLADILGVGGRGQHER